MVERCKPQKHDKVAFWRLSYNVPFCHSNLTTMFWLFYFSSSSTQAHSNYTNTGSLLILYDQDSLDQMHNSTLVCAHAHWKAKGQMFNQIHLPGSLYLFPTTTWCHRGTNQPLLSEYSNTSMKSKKTLWHFSAMFCLFSLTGTPMY